MATKCSHQSAQSLDRALSRILAEIHAGLRHGYFEFTLTCEVVGQGRRRLILHAGKNYQFVIPANECGETDRAHDPRDRAAVDACPGVANSLGAERRRYGTEDQYR